MAIYVLSMTYEIASVVSLLRNDIATQSPDPESITKTSCRTRSGIQKLLKIRDSGFRRNDIIAVFMQSCRGFVIKGTGAFFVPKKEPVPFSFHTFIFAFRGS